MTAKITSALPSDDTNGLARIARQLTSEPDLHHYVIAEIATHKITTDVETGDTTPTVRIHAIEVPRDQDAIANQLQRTYEQRTGKKPLFEDKQ